MMSDADARVRYRAWPYYNPPDTFFLGQSYSSLQWYCKSPKDSSPKRPALARAGRELTGPPRVRIPVATVSRFRRTRRSLCAIERNYSIRVYFILLQWETIILGPFAPQ